MLVVGVVGCTVAGWGLVAAFPGTLKVGDRFVYSLEKVLGGAFVFDITRQGQAPEWVDLLLGLGGALTILAVVAALFASQRSIATVSADHEQDIRRLLAASWRPRLARLLRDSSRQVGDLLRLRQGGRDLPCRRGRLPRQRRSARRSGGVVAGDQCVAAVDRAVRVGAGRHGLERGGRDRVRPGRTARPATRRRSDRPRRRLRPGRSRHAAGPPSGRPGPSRRLCRADPPPRRDRAGRDGAHHRTRGPMARHRDRAWLLDGPGPAR